MKKRKELDALVQGQKLGKRPPSKKSQPRSENKVSAHHLLGNDSESSDLDDFTIINSQRSNGKKSGATSSLCAASCLPLCLMVLVTTLIVALGTILWLHLGLREDLDLIRAHLQKVEAQSKETPEALHDYHIQLKNLEFNVTTFAEELKKINSEIISINEAVRQLKSTTASLKESIAAAPEMKTLPNDFKEITGTVVNLGSKITQLEANVKELKTTQTELKNSAQSLQHGQEEIKGNVTSLIQMKEEISSNKDIISRSETSFKDSLMAQVYKEIHHVQELFDELNSTVMPKISNLTEWGSRINEMNESLVWAVSDLSSLHAFVYSNLTSMMRQVQSESTPGDASPLVEQTVLKILTDALNNNSPDQSGSNWKHLLREACRMVNIYADVFKNLSQPINGASSLIEHMVVDFERLNDTIHHLEMSESQTATFQSSVNQTFSQLRDQMNSFSIQLALIKSGRPTSSQSSINARIMETTSNPITTTITSVKKPATNPVPIPTQDLRSPISNRNIHKTESILKRALGGF